MSLRQGSIRHSSVLEAIAEFDRLGRDVFLEKYGFGRAKRWYLVHEGKAYDSKAIIGAAYGFENPSDGPLANTDFSGGDYTVGAILRRLGFTVTNSIPGELEAPLVLVENERTEGGKYDDWDDATGERYHYPNQYRNKVKSGRRFIYYRGSRRKEGSGKTPEYFGWGVIGEVIPDPVTEHHRQKAKRRWICQIEEYVPFGTPVPFKVDGEPFEGIAQNQWGVGVRVLDQGVFESILRHSGVVEVPGSPKAKPAFLLPPMDQVQVTAGAKGLMRQVLPMVRSTMKTSGASRRSKYSKELGDRGEALVYRHLEQMLSKTEKRTLKWIAQEGGKPGWDIEYKSGDEVVGVEVKATSGSYFPSVELTANEWRAAEELGPRYRLALVTDVASTVPQLEIIDDPFGCAKPSGGFEAMPSGWRLVRSYPPSAR